MSRKIQSSLARVLVWHPIKKSPLQIRDYHLSPSVKAAVTSPFLPWSEILPYRSIRVDLTEAAKGGWKLEKMEDFKPLMQTQLEEWRAEGRSGVWLYLPHPPLPLIPVASELGFCLHHASHRKGEVVLNKWLRKGNSRLPQYASHQVGVCGVVQRDDTGEVVVVQEKLKLRNIWKFPGGVSEHAEDIADTAVREVKEETGITSEFRSILAFRQQHHLPNAFDCSDLYVICRMKPLTFDLHPCEHEIAECKWMSLDELAASTESTHLSRRVAALLMEGHCNGFHTVDMTMEEWPSVYRNLTYKLYLRAPPP